METEIQQTNDDIVHWAKESAKAMRDAEGQLGIRHTPGSNWERTSFGRGRGIINRVSFKMPRHAIFVHKGVGRGTTVESVGNTKRRPKPWFNPVIDSRIDDLADIVADGQADLIVNNANIK